MLKAKKTFFIAAGGTGGHILPGLSIYHRIRSHKHQVKFICREKDYLLIKDLKAIKKDLIFFTGYGLKRSITLKNLIFLYHLCLNIFRSFVIFFRYYPDAVISMGGYITYPVLLMSWLFRRPFFIHEQNSYPGMVNRIFGSKAKKVFVNFPYSKKFFTNSVITGNPIRKELKKKISKKYAMSFFKIKGSGKILLIMGGSQGSLKINQIVEQSLKKLKNYNIIWIVGKRHFHKYKKYNSERIKILSYIKEMAYVYQLSDLAVCRAGAMSITELSYYHVPAVFIPLAHAANNHQYLNAKTIIRMGGAKMIEEKNLTEKSLVDRIRHLFENDVLLKQYKNNIKKFYQENSEDKIVKEIYLMLDT